MLELWELAQIVVFINPFLPATETTGYVKIEQMHLFFIFTLFVPKNYSRLKISHCCLSLHVSMQQDKTCGTFFIFSRAVFLNCVLGPTRWVLSQFQMGCVAQ